MGERINHSQRVYCITMLRLVLVCLVVIFSMYLADIEVDVNEDFNSMSEQDRTIVCGFTGQLRCAAACTGKNCSSVCTATCGYIIRRTVNFTCSAVRHRPVRPDQI